MLNKKLTLKIKLRKLYNWSNFIFNTKKKIKLLKKKTAIINPKNFNQPSLVK